MDPYHNRVASQPSKETFFFWRQTCLEDLDNQAATSTNLARFHRGMLCWSTYRTQQGIIHQGGRETTCEGTLPENTRTVATPVPRNKKRCKNSIGTWFIPVGCTSDASSWAVGTTPNSKPNTLTNNNSVMLHNNQLPGYPNGYILGHHP